MDCSIGRLHFQKAARFQLAAQRCNNLGPRDEHFADLRVRDQIKITLAIAGLDIFQAVPLLGHGEQRFRQEIQVFDVDAELIGPGTEQVAFDADQVAQIEQLIERVFLFADRVLAHINLQLFAILHQVREPRLAHAANGHNAPGDTDFDATALTVPGSFRHIRPGPAEWYA